MGFLRSSICGQLESRLLTKWPKIDTLTLREAVDPVPISRSTIWNANGLLLQGIWVIVPLEVHVGLAAGASISIRCYQAISLIVELTRLATENNVRAVLQNFGCPAQRYA